MKTPTPATALHHSLARFNPRLIVMGILSECPHGKALPDCPLTAVRALPPPDRWAWARSLSDEECRHILEHHFECSASRDALHSTCPLAAPCALLVPPSSNP